MANLSSKVTPSGVATAAQGGLADSAVQPNDSPTFGNIIASGTEPYIRISETDTSAQHRIISSGGTLYIQAEDSDGTTDGDMQLTGMNATDLRQLSIKAVNTTLSGKLTLPTAQYHYSSDGKARLYYYENGDTLFRTADDFLFRNNANTTVAQIHDTGAIHTISTVTATSFIGDGSALTGVGGSTTYGDVGTYVWGRRTGSTADQAQFVAGTTYAGNTLYPAGISGNYALSTLYWSSSGTMYGGDVSAAALSGTWRAMGTTHPTERENPETLFVRIS